MIKLSFVQGISLKSIPKQPDADIRKNQSELNGEENRKNIELEEICNVSVDESVYTPTDNEEITEEVMDTAISMANESVPITLIRSLSTPIEVISLTQFAYVPSLLISSLKKQNKH